MIQDTEASKSRTCLFPDNKKQKTFTSKNNLQYIGALNPQGERVLESTRETIAKSLNFY